MSQTKLYAVLDSLRHNGQKYSPSGENNTVELSDAEAAPLLAAGVISNSAGSSDSGKTEAPEGDAKIDAIKKAIGTLDKDNEDLWTKSNKPQTDAIAAVTGWPVSAKERDAAWEALQAAE